MLLALSLFGLSPGAISVLPRLILRLCTGSGTLLCGLAPSMDALIAARAIAGMGGGG